jgi:hypothetical protein
LAGFRFYSRGLLAASALTGTLLASPSLAQSIAAEEDAENDAIVVSGEREVQLDAESKGGSRLGLTIRETPATLDVLTQERRGSVSTPRFRKTSAAPRRKSGPRISASPRLGIPAYR